MDAMAPRGMAPAAGEVEGQWVWVGACAYLSPRHSASSPHPQSGRSPWLRHAPLRAVRRKRRSPQSARGTQSLGGWQGPVRSSLSRKAAQGFRGGSCLPRWGCEACDAGSYRWCKLSGYVAWRSERDRGRVSRWEREERARELSVSTPRGMHWSVGRVAGCSWQQAQRRRNV